MASSSRKKRPCWLDWNACAVPENPVLMVEGSVCRAAFCTSATASPGVSLGEAVADVQKAARQTLPSTISTGFSGTAQAFQSSQQGLFFLLLLAIVVIYIVLGILYESFIHPLTILSGLPFAGFV